MSQFNVKLAPSLRVMQEQLFQAMTTSSFEKISPWLTQSTMGGNLDLI
jgi:hypothetical protein